MSILRSDPTEFILCTRAHSQPRDWSYTRLFASPVSGSVDERIDSFSLALFRSAVFFAISCLSSLSLLCAPRKRRMSTPAATDRTISTQMQINHHVKYHGVKILNANFALCPLHTPSLSRASTSSRYSPGARLANCSSLCVVSIQFELAPPNR